MVPARQTRPKEALHLDGLRTHCIEAFRVVGDPVAHDAISTTHFFPADVAALVMKFGAALQVKAGLSVCMRVGDDNVFTLDQTGLVC